MQFGDRGRCFSGPVRGRTQPLCAIWVAFAYQASHCPLGRYVTHPPETSESRTEGLEATFGPGLVPVAFQIRNEQDRTLKSEPQKAQ
jgi:hypothetical protein